MGTSTPELSLYKPDDGELVDVELHLNDNMDKVDAGVVALKTGSATGYVKFLGGGKRSTDSGDIDDSPEVVFASSGPVDLPANSAIKGVVKLGGNVNATDGQYVIKLKLTNLAGAILAQAAQTFRDASVPLFFTLEYDTETTSAETVTWVATAQRISGTGRLVAQAGSAVEIYYLNDDDVYDVINP